MAAGAESQPALAHLQAVLSGQEKSPHLLAVQDSGHGIPFRARGDDQADAGARSLLRRLDFRHHAAGAAGRSRVACRLLDGRRDFRHFVDQDGVGVRRRIRCVISVDIRQDDDQVRVGQAAHEGGHVVVVPDFEVVQGDRIVFIDNGNDAHFQQFHKRVARIDVVVPVPHFHPRQEHLGHRDAIFGKSLLVGMHQDSLPHGGDGLLARDGPGFFRQAQAIDAHGLRPAGHKDNFLAPVVEVAQLPRQMVDAGKIPAIVRVGDGTRPDLDDNPLCLPQVRPIPNNHDLPPRGLSGGRSICSSYRRRPCPGCGPYPLPARRPPPGLLRSSAVSR